MARILVVEDDRSLGLALSEVFESDCHEVRAVTGIAGTRGLIEDWRPDLMVLDIRLRDGDGFQLLRETTRNHPTIRTIVYTAYAQYKLDFTSWLADRYIVKGGPMQEIRHSARELLEEHPTASNAHEESPHATLEAASPGEFEKPKKPPVKEPPGTPENPPRKQPPDTPEIPDPPDPPKPPRPPHDPPRKPPQDPPQPPQRATSAAAWGS